MAVKRPNFSRSKASSKKVTEKPTQKAVKKTVKKTKKASIKTVKEVPKTKKSSKAMRVFLYLLLIGFFLVDGGWPPGSGLLEGQAQESRSVVTPQEDTSPSEGESGNNGGTRILGEVGLSTEEMRVVATNIYRVANAMTDEYEVADGLSLSMYVLRYLAEIGEYEIAYKDIMILVKAFEKYTGQSVSEEVYNILEQVSKIRFGKREGRYFSQFFSKKPSVGIIIPIEERSEDPDSSLKEIKRVVVVDGSLITFNDVDTEAEKKQVRDFIKTPVKILNVLEKIVEALYQVHGDLIEGVDDYLEWQEGPAPAMILGMQGISVEVATRTLFNDITFDFKEAYTFPGIRLGNIPVPSFALGGKAKLLNLKVSVDQ